MGAQTRSTALNNMQAALPLHDVQIFSTALDFLVAVLGHLMLTALRHVVHLQSQLTLLERELVRRRAFDIGLRFMRYSHTSDQDKRQSSSFEEAFESLRAELVTFYRSCGDHAEANCISTSTLEVQPYLTGFSFDMLARLSAELCNVLQYAFKDINPKYQDVLDPKKCVCIDTSHLAILSGRMNNTIDPDKCGITMQPDITGRNELHLAVETGDLCYLEWTLNNKQRHISFDLEQRDTLGFTPLMIAAYVGCLGIFRLLLREGANVSAQLATGRSILSLASMAGNEDIVAEIIAYGVKVQDCIGFCSPIHDAAVTGRSEAVVKLLLNHKAEPRDERAEHGNRSASQIAFANNHHNIGSILLEAEKALERELPTKDPHGRTIESLKRLIGQEMARSNSPESPAASRMGRTSSPGSEHTRKRHKSINSDWQVSAAIASSTSSTPRAHTTMAPSPLGQTIVGSYSVRTFSNLESDIAGLPMDDYIISPHDAEYESIFDMS
ncbi:hypothetical protein LTS08_002812 [Lithohypha guttulata]|nr:hypothetical protein LTS08_002812 [Lithohypha guttulata]